MNFDPDFHQRMKAYHNPEAKPERLDPIQKSKKNPGSRQLAIRAYCYSCSGENSDPHWRWRIGNCEIPECPLWRFRPYQKLWETKSPFPDDPNHE